MIEFLHLAVLAAYLGAWGLFLRAFREGGGALEITGLKVAAAAAVLHLAALVGFSVHHGTLPLVGLGPASSSLAWVVALLALAAAARSEARPTVLFMIPLVLFLLAEAVAVGVQPTSQQTAFRGVWFVVHVGTVFVGYAGLALASAAAAMYVLQFRTLKRKSFGAVFRFFPALDTLDRLNRTGLQLGFPALTVGIVAGWSWTLTYGAGLELGDPEVIFGVVTWAAYLGAILARLLPGGRGARSARATAAAFTLTVAAFGFLRLAVDSGGFFL